jgi:DNA-directed RNA polymerase sigma subunit (sigma70/sigma32)
MTLTVGEAVRLTEQANVNNTEVVTVTAINGSNISLEASYRDTLDSTLFTVSSTVDFSSFNYGTQSDDEKWDAAEVLSDVSLSLTDRANVDFNNQYSIMKFLHDL